LCGGSGASLYPHALRKGADLFVTGEFILESKAFNASIGGKDYAKYNFFGDPALNLMAEGYEITQTTEFVCPITISTPVTVRSGVDLTIPPDCGLEFIDNGQLIIDEGARLFLSAGSVIQGIDPQHAILVNGEIHGAYVHAPITFSAPEPHRMGGLSIVNPDFEKHLFQEFVFENADLHIVASDIILKPHIGRNSFINSHISVKYGSISIENTDFENSNIILLRPADGSKLVEISNCTFDNNDSPAFPYCINLRDYERFDINNNTFEYNNNEAISLYNAGNIGKHNEMMHITDNVISYSGNDPYLSKGIETYNSRVNIIDNTITNADYGIVGMNNSLIFVGGSYDATIPEETQIISDNISYQMYFTGNSFPRSMRYNLINNGENPAPLIYNDANPPLGSLFNVENNCWDEDFYAPDDLLPSGYYDWLPEWCPTTTTTIESTQDEIIYASAMMHVDSSEYQNAESDFKEIISDYPETETAKDAAKQLFELEGISDNDFQGLKDYYETEPNLQLNNDLGKLTSWLISYCNVKIGDPQAAIDWYDNVIDTTSSESDSTFAAIDMGEAYLAMDSMKSYLSCNNNQFLIQSRTDFEANRSYLIDELLKSKDKESELPTAGRTGQDLGILYQNVPNPFSGSTSIKIELLEECNIELVVFDNVGKKILTLGEGTYSEGQHDFHLNVKDMQPGIYFYCLSIENKFIATEKILIIN